MPKMMFIVIMLAVSQLVMADSAIRQDCRVISATNQFREVCGWEVIPLDELRTPRMCIRNSCDCPEGTQCLFLEFDSSNRSNRYVCGHAVNSTQRLDFSLGEKIWIRYPEGSRQIDHECMNA